MSKRITLTLAICAVAGALAVGALALPANDVEVQTEAAANQPGAATVEGNSAYSGEAEQPVEGQEASGAAAESVAAITIEGFAFEVPGTFQPGQSVTVTNVDGAPHTLTSNDGAFDTGIIDGGGSGSLTVPTAPGTYSFFCDLHPGMQGSLTVT